MFRTALESLRSRYECVRLDDVDDFNSPNERARKPPVLLTFDDGFRHNLRVAEMLSELGLSAVFYIVTDTIDQPFVPWFLRFAHILSTRSRNTGTAPWGSVDFAGRLSRRRWIYRGKEYLLAIDEAERSEALAELSSELRAAPLDPADPDYQFLNADELRQMVSLGMTIGCHTATHDNLARLDADGLRRELCDSADKLERIIGCKVDSVSYPDGRYNAEVLRVSRERFRTGFTIRPERRGGDPFQLGRRPGDGLSDFGPVLSPIFPFRSQVRGTIRQLIERWP